ncbi:MAG TPA: conjugal transfer protein TraR [Rheinheimera sp.]|nr:conjugal transfer protein TraR [Rheinheimera sp.]
MPQSLTPLLRSRLLSELELLQQDILHYLAADHVAEYQQLHQQLQKHPTTHWPDLMKKWQTPELQEKSQRLELVQAALSQMDMGLYGLCSDCECRIERQLLMNDPARQRCAACETLYHEQLAE